MTGRSTLATDEHRSQAWAILAFSVLLLGLAAGFALSLGLAETNPSLSASLQYLLN